MSDVLLIGLVFGLRFVVPLLILRFPLPGILAAVVADSIDGAILRGYTGFDVELYQHFDKAFDCYYLVIAYIAILRNWTDPAAIAIGRWLFYFRLVGVVLFAVSGQRAVLFMFPSTFEWYFIAIEVVRVRWSASRLTSAHLVAIASVAWLVKLPQEYWLHVAGRSTTEWVKADVFGMDPSVSRLDVLVAHPWLVPAAAAAAVGLVVMGRIALAHLPSADHPTRFDADAYHGRRRDPEGQPRTAARVVSPALVDKIALVSLVGIVFAEFLPGVHANAVQLSLGVSALVLASAVMSERLARNGVPWRSPAAEFATLVAVNAPMMFVLTSLDRWTRVSFGPSGALAYVAIVSLVIAVYDRSRDVAA